MESDKSDLDLIERYLNGSLSAHEIDLVERRIEDDREFARKLRLRKTFPHVMKPGEVDKENQPGLQDFSWEFDLKSRRNIHWKGILLLTLLVIPAILFTYFYVTDPPEAADEPKEVSIAPAHDPVTALPVANTSEPSGNIQTSQTNQPSQPSQTSQTSQPSQTSQTQIDNTINASGEPFILVSPNDGALIDRTGEISFRWQQIPDSITHIYIIAESTQNVIWWRAVRTGIREFNVPASHFRAGKYRWYVGMKKTMRSFSISE